MPTDFMCGTKRAKTTMAAKYKEFFELMLQNNKELFESFRETHDEYTLDPDSHQDRFNEVGAKALRIIRQWEDKLCSRSEGSGYGKYSTGLAEKFQSEVRKKFPKIDSVGLKPFSVKKIELH
jgi:hypothetical protein